MSGRKIYLSISKNWTFLKIGEAEGTTETHLGYLSTNWRQKTHRHVTSGVIILSFLSRKPVSAYYIMMYHRDSTRPMNKLTMVSSEVQIIATPHYGVHQHLFKTRDFTYIAATGSYTLSVCAGLLLRFAGRTAQHVRCQILAFLNEINEMYPWMYGMWSKVHGGS